MSDMLTHIDAGVMTITFNRLDKKNSITAAMYAAMADAVGQAAADPAVRVLVFQGHERIFSAGNDIGDFLNQPPTTQDAPVFRFLRGIATFEKPLLAAVAGPAVGIGTTLLFHCDLVYAGDNAAFSMPFVNLGLCPEAASSWLVPRMFGHHRAAEALLMGEPFFAEAAQEVGLVNRVLPPTEVNAYAQAQARKLAAKPLSSLVATKRLMKGSDQSAVLQKMDEEAQSFGRMLREPAAKEAFGAFMEKRKPDFSKL
jgi:enoyl-CoA hydratase/carnithine racemase